MSLLLMLLQLLNQSVVPPAATRPVSLVDRLPNSHLVRALVMECCIVDGMTEKEIERLAGRPFFSFSSGPVGAAYVLNYEYCFSVFISRGRAQVSRPLPERLTRTAVRVTSSSLTWLVNTN
jgi:hypothetical protein